MQTNLKTHKWKKKINAVRLARGDLYINFVWSKGEMLGVCVTDDTYDVRNIRGCGYTNLCGHE